MGLVFLARDEQTGLPVALKVLQSPDHSAAARRFAREAEILNSLRHPRVVSYVAYGVFEGQPFLAMEWLEGEDLAKRLATKPLRLTEALQVLQSSAEALAVAHAQGIVHRDLKPSNLFLRAGQPWNVVVLDFGLAHISAASQFVTGSDTVLGTPTYMAPEQASSDKDLSPAADIFSLGCVFYECLTGYSPFQARHWAAVLAKILFSKPPPLRALRPDIPAELGALVERMLAKDPRQRLTDGRHVLQALVTLEPMPDLDPPGPKSSLAGPEPESKAMFFHGADFSEKQLVSVLLATARTPLELASTPSLEGAGLVRQYIQVLVKNLQTPGVSITLLADGSLLVTFVLERGTATDQAALAARCALSALERWPDSVVALATGLSLRGHDHPVGEVMDRAGELLQKAMQLPSTSQVLVDDTTMGLLSSPFQVEKVSSGTFLLSGAALSVDESRLLLGRPTPCVGREQELALLELAFTSCVEDSSARALLVTALAGAGKSRLRHELLRRLQRQPQPPLVLLGRGDPMNATVAYGLVGQAVRRLCEVVDGEPADARLATLTQRLTRYLPVEQHQETVEFLGELCAVPLLQEVSPRLRAARQDPRLMSGQMTRALVTWLKAEAAQSPVLLVLEDLHWSDGPSILLVEGVLRELAESPLMVLALSQPDVKELFPRLWGQYLQEVPLRALSQKASARLVREVLGAQTPEAVVARMVEMAAGNALFLEELIRSAAEGHGDGAPLSVLAMLQSRLQRLDPEARRVILAASIFGRTFWEGGVQAVLADTMASGALARGLNQLVELEFVQVQPGSRFPGEVEYRFHHALVRDAAYNLASENLLATGHMQAGRWLEATGESAPIVLAEHYKRGGEKQKALRFFIMACQQNCERQRSDPKGAQQCLEAALACEPTGQALTALEILDADISFWRNDFSRTLALSNKLLPQLREGSGAWMQIVGSLILMNAMGGRLQEAGELGRRLLAVDPAPEATNLYIEALAFLGGTYQWTGHPSQAMPVLERQAQIAMEGSAREDFAYGWWRLGQGQMEYDRGTHLWRSRRAAEDSMEAFAKIGEERNHLLPRTLLVQVLVALGEIPRALELMNEGLARAQYFTLAGTWFQVHMARVLSGDADAGLQEKARLLALLVREEDKANPYHQGLAAEALARVAMKQGALAEAEAWAREAFALLAPFPVFQLSACNVLSAVLLAQGRSRESRQQAEQGGHLLQQQGGAGSAAVGVWLALAETCEAQADDAGAMEALRRALGCLLLRLEDLPDAAARQRFLHHVPENVRVLQLAQSRSLGPLPGLLEG